MKVEAEQSIEMKYCPICSQELPLSVFGVCRARKDGRNLYCKNCIRKKVTEGRQALREYKSARKRLAQQGFETTDLYKGEKDSPSSAHSPPIVISRLSPVDRVREAIRRHARTQREIAQETRLGKDEIGDALANLLLWTREIRTEVINNTRLYFINESPKAVVLEPGGDQKVPRRKPDVPSSFSALPGLMPGKKPEGEPDKFGGWVAA